MVLVSIIIALAIANLLTAIADSVHRLRGHGEPIKLDAVYILWIVFIFFWLVSFWWWEFKFQEAVEEWSAGLYLFLVGYASILFLLATVLVPHRMQGVTHSYDYFMQGRRWFFGGLILLLAVDWVDSLLKGADWGMRPVLLLQYGALLAAFLIGLVSGHRSVQLVAAVVAFAIQLVYLFQDIGALGSW